MEWISKVKGAAYITQAKICPCLRGWSSVVSNRTLCSGLQEVKFTHLIVATGTDGYFPGKFNTTASLQTAIQAYTDLFQQVNFGQQGHAHIQ